MKQEIEESRNGWGWKGPQEVIRPNPGVWSKEVSLEDFGWADAYIPTSSVKLTWGHLQGCTTLCFFILQYPYLACLPSHSFPYAPCFLLWVVGGVAHRGGKKWAGTWEKKVVWERDTCRTTWKCFFLELGRWRGGVVEWSSLLVRTIFDPCHGNCLANRDETANTPSCWCPQIISQIIDVHSMLRPQEGTLRTQHLRRPWESHSTNENKFKKVVWGPLHWGPS